MNHRHRAWNDLEVNDERLRRTPLISVPKAAELLGLSRASAYRFAAAGDLPTRHLGGRVFVVTSRLEAFVNGDGEAA